MSASRTTKPLTAHPAFPAVVALWFAALLGLGTFVVPPANFEGLVVGTGLAELIPAAAPPLGDTARLAISAVAALLGALLGLAIAARLRRVQDQSRGRSEDVVPASNSPWLADDEDEDLAAQDEVAMAAADPVGRVDLAEAEAPGTIPSRLARRRSTGDRDDLRTKSEAAEPQEETERIFQVSEVDLGDAAEVETATNVAADGPEAAPGEKGDCLQSAEVEEEDDLQRFAADRLVAGLPRIERRNFDENPIEDWSRPEPVVASPDSEPGLAVGPPPAMDEPQETDLDGPDLERPEAVEYVEYDELPAEDMPSLDEELPSAEPVEAQDESTEAFLAPPAETEAEPALAPLDFSAVPLADLVARFDAALAAQRLRLSPGGAEPAQMQSDSARSDDPVIAFLRREVDRDRRASGESTDEQPGEQPNEQADDPRAGLRNALDKLDRVSRKS